LAIPLPRPRPGVTPIGSWFVDEVNYFVAFWTFIAIASA
jgi:hypothetical protein